MKKLFLKSIVTILLILFLSVQVKAQTQTIFDLNARSKANKVSLTWTCVENADYYNVYRGDQGGQYELIETEWESSYCTYIDYGLNYYQSYYYVVTSIDEFGIESLFSNEVIICCYPRTR